MQTSSSTSSSEGEPTRHSRSRLVRRILLYAAPYLAIGVVVAALGIRTGEFVPARLAAWEQSSGHPMLYLPRLTDHSFALKTAGADFQKPEILALGASRANQWRSAMFEADFFNAAQAVYTFKHYTEFLQHIEPNGPGVIIISVDFYNFSDDWNDLFADAQKKDLNPFDLQQLPVISLVKELVKNPIAVFDDDRDPIYGVPAIGLSAQRIGAGYRIDGSLQYGMEISGNFAGSVSTDQALERVTTGSSPFQFGDALSTQSFKDLSNFLDLAESRNIQVIGITMPYEPRLADALEASPGHGIWREFRGSKVQEYFQQRAVPYFDFSDIESFDGRASEFVDPFHASEPAYLRILLEMSKNTDVARLLALDAERLASWLDGSTNLEVFRNTFAPVEAGENGPG